MLGKSYKDMTPEEKEMHKKRVIASSMKHNKQIPLTYKKEVAAKIYAHAQEVGSSPVTWIKKAIALLYEQETGEKLQ